MIKSGVELQIQFFPELVVAIGIRWLAGGSYIDIRHEYGCRVPSIYRFRDLFLGAVHASGDLEIVFPETREDILKVASNFKSKALTT